MSDHVETTNPCLVFTATIPGEVPALARLVVDEDQGVDQLTAIAAVRVGNYDPDPPAAMYFEADALTPVGGGAAVITTSLPTGTSGSGCIAANALTTSWQDILKSTVAGSALTSVTGSNSTDVFTKTSHGMVNGASVVLSAKTGGSGLSTSTTYYVINRATSSFQLSTVPGGSAVDLGSDVSSLTVTPTTYWTHTGRYRAMARVFPSSTSTGPVSVRARWGLGDLAIYSAGAERSVTVGAWTLADLGVINIPSSATRWEFRLQAKGANGDGIYADVIYLPCADEALGTAQVTTTSSVATLTVDETFSQTAGTLNGRTPSPQADGNWAVTGSTALTSVTGADSTDTFTKTAHGLLNGVTVKLSAKTGGTLSTAPLYYVVNTAADTFQLSTAPGGSAVNLGSDVSSVTVTPWQFSVSSGYATRNAVTNTAGLNNGAFAIASSAMAGQYAQVELTYGGDAPAGLTTALVFRYTDASNWAAAGVLSTGSGIGLPYIWKCVAGTVSVIATGVVHGGVAGYLKMNNANVLTLQGECSASGSLGLNVYSGGLPVSSVGVTDSVLAVGGTLASGKIGLLDHNTGSTAITRYFDNFLGGTVFANAACYASQSVEFSSTGWRREDSAGVVWGNPGNREGDNLLIPPGTAEVFVKLSRALIGQGGDSGVDDVSAKLYVTERGLLLPS